MQDKHQAMCVSGIPQHGLVQSLQDSSQLLKVCLQLLEGSSHFPEQCTGVCRPAKDQKHYTL